MLANKIATPDDQGQYRVPLRVQTAVDLDFMATALALEHGNPPRRNAEGGWTGRVGLRRAHEALGALAHERITTGCRSARERELPEEVLDGWRIYIVEAFRLFPQQALPEHLRDAPNEST